MLNVPATCEGREGGKAMPKVCDFSTFKREQCITVHSWSQRPCRSHKPVVKMTRTVVNFAETKGPRLCLSLVGAVKLVNTETNRDR